MIWQIFHFSLKTLDYYGWKQVAVVFDRDYLQQLEVLQWLEGRW